MEVERLKAMKAFEEREKRRAEDRRLGADILKKQIEEREKERYRLEELREIERKQVKSLK